MCEELMKLMEPEIRQVEKQAHERGLEKGLAAGMKSGIEEGYRSLSKLIGLGLITEEQAAGQVEDREEFIKWRREATAE